MQSTGRHVQGVDSPVPFSIAAFRKCEGRDTPMLWVCAAFANVARIVAAPTAATRLS
jgi:hypothetical protein